MLANHNNAEPQNSKKALKGMFVVHFQGGEGIGTSGLIPLRPARAKLIAAGIVQVFPRRLVHLLALRLLGTILRVSRLAHRTRARPLLR